MIPLPWPPSVNTYWRTFQGRMIISKAGREYRKEVGLLCLRGPQFGDQRLSVSIVAFPPDRRRRDLDNMLKAILDGLQKAGVYDDDSQIDKLTIERGEVMAPGRVVVDIQPYAE